MALCKVDARGRGKGSGNWENVLGWDEDCLLVFITLTSSKARGTDSYVFGV